MRLTLAFLFFLISPAFGEPRGKKEINFEGAVVEGVGRQSLDSLSQVAEGDSQGDLHLYEKRDDYKARDDERVNEFIETY